MRALRIVLMILLPLLVVGGGGLVAYKMIEARPVPEKKAPELVRPLVRVIEAKPSAVRLTVRAEGVVAPRTESQLAPEVSGRVLEVSPSLIAGGFFEAGEVVMRVDAREYELAVIRTRAAVAQAKLKVATEEQEAEVARAEWSDLGQGEPTPLVLREPQLAEARAGLASAEASLDQALFDLERTVVKAPYTSRVRQKTVDVGQYVQRGQAVATIYAVDVAEVRLPIADEQLAFVDLPLAYRDVNDGKSKPGPAVTLRTDFAGKSYSWQGRIVRPEGEIDSRTRMVHAIAQVQDPYAQGGNASRPPLAVGMFVEAEIAGRTVRAVELPRTAMRGESSVLLVTPDNRIELRQVQVLRAERDRVLIGGGLQAGDRVCVSTLEAAVEGMEVQVLDEPETGASAS